MNSSFVTYIDESGDEGFSFGSGSSDWFVLSAVITKKTTDLATVKLVDRIRTALGKPEKKPLHFRDLKHEQRIPFISEISKADLRAISVLVCKPLITAPETFRSRFRLYFYTVRYLFERISWYCRDHRLPQMPGDGSVELIFSNRSGMSYPELKEYLEYLKVQTGPLNVQIDWRYIRPEAIQSYSSGKRMGLQIADAVASSFFYAVQSSRYGYNEDRYARLLRPVVYQRKGEYLGYGVKLWPKEAGGWKKQEVSLSWLNEYAGPGVQDPTH